MELGPVRLLSVFGAALAGEASRTSFSVAHTERAF